MRADLSDLLQKHLTYKQRRYLWELASKKKVPVDVFVFSLLGKDTSLPQLFDVPIDVEVEDIARRLKDVWPMRCPCCASIRKTLSRKCPYCSVLACECTTGAGCPACIAKREAVKAKQTTESITVEEGSQ